MSSVAESDQHSFSIPLTVDLNTGENWGGITLIYLPKLEQFSIFIIKYAKTNYCFGR